MSLRDFNTTIRMEVVYPKNMAFTVVGRNVMIPNEHERKIELFKGSASCTNNDTGYTFCFDGEIRDTFPVKDFLYLIKLFNAEKIYISSLEMRYDNWNQEIDIENTDYLYYNGIPFMRTWDESFPCKNIEDVTEYEYQLVDVAEEEILKERYEEILDIPKLKKQYPNGGKVKCKYLDEKWNVREREVVILP